MDYIVNNEQNEPETYYKITTQKKNGSRHTTGEGGTRNKLVYNGTERDKGRADLDCASFFPFAQPCAHAIPREPSFFLHPVRPVRQILWFGAMDTAWTI